LQFGENLLAENANFTLIVDNENDLSGLPQSAIDAAAETAKAKGMEGKWIFTLSKPSLIPFLQYADNRDLREKLYRGYFMRGNNDNVNDNKAVIAEMVKLRKQKANLLGYDNFASFVLEKNMAKNSENVDKFLNELYVPSLEVAKKELKEMQAIADKEGAKFQLESWDWWYYAEKLRKAKYDLNENEIRPYFVLENVRDGMFEVANKLYGITFDKRTDLPIYHEQVETFEVKEADGSHIGILYLDYYPRESKSGGAWCTGFREAGSDINGNKITPIVSLVCNFTPPTANTPALLTWDDVTTLFHEFGHGLHGLFTQGKYTRTAGVVPRDYVELPSQIMENWAGEPEVLRMYAKHYQTGEIIPESLINKLQNSSLFNQGFETVEYLAASILDMDYHKLTTDEKIEPIAFEKNSMDNIGLINEILPRYRSTYFSHIFDGGYATGYYVYYWAAVLDADAFDYFKQSGDLFNPELAASFRKNCLAECGNDEGMVQYIKFRGQEPSVDPLLKKKGLK
jgi:peptidyl-dipeptidase Dcp